MPIAPNIDLLDEVLEMAHRQGFIYKEALAKKKEQIVEKDKTVLKATKAREIDLWHNWNTGGRKPEHMKPLIESFKPMLQSEANKYRGVELPKSTINAEIRKQAVNAFKTFNPENKGGAQLSSWVQTNLRKASRFIKTYQNLGKIPESQISKIREYKQAKETLFNQFGHEPDTKSIADHLKWPHKRVIQMQRELRDDLPASGFEGAKMQDPAELGTPKELEAIRMIQYDTRMSKEERAVYEYTFGMNGKPRLQPGQIAKLTKLHPSKISRIRGKIKTYLTEALDLI